MTINGTNSKWKTRTEIAKNVFQAAAIVVGALWALYRFDLLEKPSLETRADAVSAINWFSSPTGENECVAQFKASLENIGTASFDIESVRLRGWTFERQLKEDEIATYIDDEEVQEHHPFFEKEFRDGKFIQRYPPTVIYSWTYEWVVKNEPNRLIFIRIDFDGKADGSGPFSTHTISWSPICGQQELERE